MTSVSIHGPTGVLLVDGQKVFPIGLSDPPPHDARAPSGEHAFQELANAGATMIRTGTPDWALVRINHQIAAEKAIQDTRRRARPALLDAARPGREPARCGRQSAAPAEDHAAFKNHPALCAYKGVDEPRNPFRGANWIRPAGLVKAHAQAQGARSRASARHHPGAARPGLAADRLPPGLRRHGRRHLPDRVPAGLHCDNGNTDISVVGDMTDKMGRRAAASPSG